MSQYTPSTTIYNKNKTNKKGKILRVLKEKKQITHKYVPTHLTEDFSVETLNERRGHDTFIILKEKTCQPRILNLAKLSFRN
jgi:hypothetical protein